MEDKNINIRVEKRKKSIIPLLIVILIILIGAVGVIYYKITGKDDNLQVENPPLDIVPEPELPKVEVLSKEARQVYDSLETARWASKDKEKYVIFTVSEGKLVYISENAIGQLKYTKNDVKYLMHIIKDGMVYAITFINEDNEAYIGILNDIDDIYTYDLSKVEFEKVGINEKIIDITMGESIAMPYNRPYYLTASGKLLTSDGTTYEEINRNHAFMMGNSNEFVFVNKNKTLEVLRNPIASEYLNVLDEKGNVVYAKDVFSSIEEENNITYYVVDTDKNLLYFSSKNIFIAKPYLESKNNVVESVEYDDQKSQIRVIFIDQTFITIDNINYYKNLE